MDSLSDKKLSFCTAVEIRTLPDGARLLKQTERGEYLALTSEQRDILEQFDGEKTVEEILHLELVQGRNPGIRAFYDLVLSSINRGFLREDSVSTLKQGKETSVAGLSAHGVIGVIFSLAMIAAGALAIFTSEIRLGDDLIEWFKALALTSLGLSLSHALAGSTLHGLGRQAYDARVRWDRLLPFFALDTRDAFMGGRGCEIAVALRALCAPFMLAAIGWLFDSDAAMLASCLAAIALASPFGETPTHTLLHSAFRKEYELPKCAQRFLNAKLFAQMFNWKDKLEEENYLLTYSTYAILWLSGVFYFANFLVHTQIDALYIAMLAELPLENEGLTRFALALLSVILAGVIVYFVWLIVRGAHRLLAPHFFRAETRVVNRPADPGRPEEAATLEFLRSALLFSQISDDLLKELAAAMKYITTAADKTVIRERDPGDAMFVLHTGQVEVCKENESGFLNVLATLGPGDVFGEMALLDKAPRNSSVRSRTATGLFTLARKDFDQLLVKALGADKIREIVQISAFLKRNQLFSDWHQNALVTLAHKFSLVELLAGQRVIEKDQRNENFYIVYEGRFKVVKDDVELATLGPGKFCGEISLLSDAPANADVVAASYGKCLKLDKQDFLKFVSHDFLTGLTIETTAASRAKAGGPA
ncbi:MAG: cyclic nucleotide-binding domain-containing protein [Verrucomicrobiia bacterium]|jgi:CRP-like cAMP-binding protein